MSTLEDAYPEIEAFRAWIDSNSIKGITAKGAPHDKFIPYNLLRRYFTEDNNAHLRKLVHKCCPREPQRYIVDAILTHDFVRAFAILLLINEGPLIKQFITVDNLSDSRMPFTGETPTHFPQSSIRKAEADVFEHFRRKQWIFFPAHIEARTKHLEPEHILPITHKESLESGGSAETSKITVHPDYNRLRHALSEEYSQTNVFVMKTFLPLHIDEYEKERKVFLHLRGQNQSRTNSLIRYHGSLEQKDMAGERTFSIILDYASGGDLETLFQKQEPPRRPAEIAGFWIQLLEVLQALTALHSIRIHHPDGNHYMNGWHQDVKPQNILIVLKEGKPLYLGDYKLADLGLAHVRPRDGPRVSANVKQGTKTYGAPECYSADVFSEGLYRSVDPSADIWSLGCVLSEAMVWLVGGYSSLEAYRLERYQMTSAISGHQDLSAFHDGNGNVLKCVSDRHDAIKVESRAGDKVTPHVLELVRKFMLLSGEARSHAASVLHQWQGSCGPRREAERIMLGQDSTATSPPLSPSEGSCGVCSPCMTGKSFTSEPKSMHSDRSFNQEDLPRNSQAIPNGEGPVSPPPTDQRERNSHSPLNTSTTETERDPPPDWPVVEALSWLQDRRSTMKSKLDVPNTAFRDELKGRDYVFLIDDSLSMRSHWSEVAEIVALLSEILFALKADDAIDVELISGDGKCVKSSSNDLKDFILSHSPPNVKDRKLNVERYIDKFFRAYFARLRVTGILAKIKKGRKPLNLCVLTDGRFQDGNKMEIPIKKAIDTLNELGKPKYFAGIQFIQFGTDMKGGQRLDDLDTFARFDGLNRDIVDTEPSSGNVWKMILGSINETFDHDKIQEQTHHWQEPLNNSSPDSPHNVRKSSSQLRPGRSFSPYRDTQTKASSSSSKHSSILSKLGIKS